MRHARARGAVPHGAELEQLEGVPAASRTRLAEEDGPRGRRADEDRERCKHRGEQRERHAGDQGVDRAPDRHSHRRLLPRTSSSSSATRSACAGVSPG